MAVALMCTYIAGPRHHRGALDAIALMPAGQPLALVREPGNPHDPNAVCIRDRVGLKLGYVPRVDAPAVAKAMDGGYTVEARTVRDGSNVIHITWERKKNEVSL